MADKSPITGISLVLLTVSLSLATFMNVLDTSIANVSIPTIAGDLGVSPNEGTWIITSFAVSMAISLPLTGWLAKRFGEVKLFMVTVSLFTIASLACGLSPNLPMLLTFRVLQGAVAGPMIPLSQSLLLANYPADKKGLATALWAMVVVVAPIFGPILGGWITDNFTWPWIFYINIPVGIFSVLITWQLLHNRETEKTKLPIDGVGLALLIIGIGSLQILLDKGQDLDWFGSSFIVALAIISTISLTILIIWELTEPYPVVDLSLFLRRNFTIGTIAFSIGYMTFFGSIVVFPLWLQTQMGYTPTWAGLALAPIGILSVIGSPIVGRYIKKLDLRMLISFSFLLFAYVSFWRSSFNTNVSFAQLALPVLVQGIGIPCFFIPLVTVLLSGLPDNRLASASGLSNFLRILGGSFGTSISISLWNHREKIHHTQLTQNITAYNSLSTQTVQKLQGLGFHGRAAYEQIARLITNQSYMLSTNDIFWISGIVFLSLFGLIWFARPPFLSSDAAGGTAAH